MKKLILISLILASSFLTSFSKSGYEVAMKDNIDALNKAESQEELMAIANKFERIGLAEKEKWQPFYYTAFSYVLMATKGKNGNKCDEYLDVADIHLDMANKLDGDMVEILVLRAFSSLIRINVDPAVRGQEYSMKSAGLLQQASQLDDENPRVLLMLGQIQYGTAQFFGADTQTACKQFTNALAKFESQVKNEDSLWPSWGKETAEAMKKKCEG